MGDRTHTPLEVNENGSVVRNAPDDTFGSTLADRQVQTITRQPPTYNPRNDQPAPAILSLREIGVLALVKMLQAQGLAGTVSEIKGQTTDSEAVVVSALHSLRHHGYIRWEGED